MNEIFTLKKVWIKGVIPNFCYFLWLAYRNIILTQENMRKRDMMLE